MEREKYFADVPMQGYRIVLQVLRLQFKCRACGRIFIQPVPGVDTNRRMTIRLIDYINREVPKRTFAAVADEIGLNEKTVRNVFRDHIQAMNGLAAPAPSTERDRRSGQWILGIDEVFYRNDYERSKAANTAKQRLDPGQKKRRAKKPSQHHSGQFLSVLIDMNRRVVVDILRHRHPYLVSAELRKLPGADQIKVVCMDMAKQTFYAAVKDALPHASIVIDKFHVLEKANTILKSVRAAHRAEARFVEKREDRLNPFEKLRLATFQSTCPQLYDAYQSKELLYSIYDQENRREALRAYGVWCRFTRTSKVKKKFEVLIKMLKDWREPIFAYFDHPPITNALTETTNGIIKLINRNGRGHSYEMLRGKILGYQGISPAQRKKGKVNKRGKYLHEETLETRWEKEADKLEAMGAGEDHSQTTEFLDSSTGVTHQIIRITTVTPRDPRTRQSKTYK